MAKSVFRRFPADDISWYYPDVDESDGGPLFFPDDQGDAAWQVGEDFWEAPGGITNAGNIASAGALGQPSLSPNLTTSAIGGAEAFGQPTVSTGVQLTNAGNIAAAEAFGSPGLAVALLPGGIASGQLSGSPTVSAAVSASGVGPADAYGMAALSAAVSATGIVSAGALGAPSLWGSVSVAGIASIEAFGEPTVSTQVVLAEAGDIASAEATGAPGVSVVLVPAGLASEELFGSPDVTVPYPIGPYGIYSGQGFGTPVVSLKWYVRKRAKSKDGAPIAGATALLYNSDSYELEAQGLTDSEGWCALECTDGYATHFIVLLTENLAAVSKRDLVGR